MTLIDADLAHLLDQEILTIDPVNIKGLDSCVKSSKYVNLDLYMLGYMGDTAAAGKLHLEAYLVVKDVARRRGLRVRKCDRTGKGG